MLSDELLPDALSGAAAAAALGSWADSVTDGAGRAGARESSGTGCGAGLGLLSCTPEYLVSQQAKSVGKPQLAHACMHMPWLSATEYARVCQAPHTVLLCEVLSKSVTAFEGW